MPIWPVGKSVGFAETTNLELMIKSKSDPSREGANSELETATRFLNVKLLSGLLAGVRCHCPPPPRPPLLL